MLTVPQLNSSLKSGKTISQKLGGRGSGALLFKARTPSIGEFYFRYTDGAQRKLIKIGNYKSQKGMAGLTLEEAREKAQELSKIYREEKDVKGFLEDKAKAQEEARHKREAKKAQGTFQQLVDSYVNKLRTDGKASATEVEKSIERSVFKQYPNLKNKKACEVTTQDIKGILAQMIESGITTQSNRVRSYLLAAFNHGIKQENNPRIFLDESTIFNITHNPVAAIPRQADYEKTGETVLSENELRDLWHNIGKTNRVGFVMTALIRFALATGGQRLKQILATPWERFDLEEKTMSIHDSKGKGNKIRVHIVPLGDLALSVLEELKPITGDSKYPFSGGSHGNKKDKHIRPDSIGLAISRYREENPATNFKASDFRRTCKTIMAKNRISKEARDRLHNHALNDVATKHYDMHDYLEEKRITMNHWNNILSLIIYPKEKISSLKHSHNS